MVLFSGVGFVNGRFGLRIGHVVGSSVLAGGVDISQRGLRVGGWPYFLVSFRVVSKKGR